MDRLNHHHLYIYWTLAKQGSFTRAAEELVIAQSAVTSQIRQLEEYLGLTLVDRSNKRRIELTAEGRKVLDFADSIFEASQELLDWAREGEAQKQTKARVRIGALSGLSRNLQYQFLEPLADEDGVSVEVTTGDQDKLIALLKEHRLDVLLSSHNVRPSGGVPFYSHVLSASPLVFVSSHDKSAKTRAELRACLKETRLYLPGLQFEARPELDAYLESLKCPLRIAGEIDDIALLRIFAIRSGALVVIPEVGVQSDIEDGTLGVLKRLDSIEQRFYAITRQKRFSNRIVERLILFMRKQQVH